MDLARERWTAASQTRQRLRSGPVAYNSVDVPIRWDVSSRRDRCERTSSGRAGVGEHGTRRGLEMVDMRMVIPPGQRLPEVSAHVSISRTEAIELRDALDMAQASGSSRWSVNVEWAEIEASVSLMLEMDVPRNGLDSA
jgi:hypothetical protein